MSEICHSDVGIFGTNMQHSVFVNPLPHVPILGSSNSAANKDMMAKVWTNGDTII